MKTVAGTILILASTVIPSACIVYGRDDWGPLFWGSAMCFGLGIYFLFFAKGKPAS